MANPNPNPAPDPKQMVYANWNNSRAHLATSADWFETIELMKAVQEVKRKCLTCTNAAVMRAYELILLDLNYQAPYSEHERFPGEKFYVCDLIGDWKPKLAQLRALCLELNRTSDTETNAKFYNCVMDISENLLRGAHFIDRNEFEKWAFIEWVERKDLPTVEE